MQAGSRLLACFHFNLRTIRTEIFSNTSIIFERIQPKRAKRGRSATLRQKAVVEMGEEFKQGRLEC
jgi:hypothetical protein